MKKIIISLVTILILTSCSTQRFSVNPKNNREVPKSTPHFSKWNHFFFWGIGQTKFNDATAMCKNSNGVSFVETKLTFAQGLVAGLTYGIYSPRGVNIYCNKD